MTEPDSSKVRPPFLSTIQPFALAGAGARAGVAMDSVLGVPWGEFVRGLRTGSIVKPFLVQEGEGSKPAWAMYGITSTTLVQVFTFVRQPRRWRTVDGALSDLERSFAEVLQTDRPALLPPVIVCLSTAAVDGVLFPEPG